jgi:microcystin-dependent protein
MTQPFVGQIQSFGFNFAPRGWALCDGAILSITQNPALFSLIGTSYGGNGTSNFALPDLQSRVPIHYGTAPAAAGGDVYSIGEPGGVENVTLSPVETPVHTHIFSGTSGSADAQQPAVGASLAQSNDAGTSPGNSFYGAPTVNNPLLSINIGSLNAYAGGGLPHTNIQPYLTINWCIALQGIFPARN